MSTVWEFVSPHLGTFVFAALSALAAWGISRLNLKQELKDAIDAFTKRVVDKASDWYQIVVAPASDGGSKITAQEMSTLRQAAWDLLKEETKGPLAKLLLAWGEDRVKGMIGTQIEKMGLRATPETKPDSGAPGS